jgi:hypothetical protein
MASACLAATADQPDISHDTLKQYMHAFRGLTYHVDC